MEPSSLEPISSGPVTQTERIRSIDVLRGLALLGILVMNIYALMIAAGVLAGLPIIIYGVHRNFAAGWDFEACFYLGPQFNYWGSLFVAAGWLGVIMLMCKHSIAPRLTRTLAAVGQMALTNYLLQTVICTTIFYGHGLGLFGKLDRVEQILTVVCVWIVLIIFSRLWLARFRFGPAEWLWRSLTYKKAQPMRRLNQTATNTEPRP